MDGVSNIFTDMVARIYRRHLSYSTQEGNSSWPADVLSQTDEWDMVTVSNFFPVHTEIFSMGHRDLGMVVREWRRAYIFIWSIIVDCVCVLPNEVFLDPE